jgi:hypothetical protein
MSISSSSEWTVEEVCHQLDDIGVESEFISLFREAGIDGQRLLAMREEDLIRLGMTSGRKVVLKFIDKQHKSSAAPSQSQTCPAHLGQPSTLFCRCASSIICGVCTATTHKGDAHDVITMEEAHEELMISLLDQHDTLVSEGKHAVSIIHTATTSIEELLSSTKTSTQDIEDLALSLHEAVDQAKEKALLSLKERSTAVQHRAESEARKAEIFQRDVTRLVKSIEEVIAVSDVQHAHVFVSEAPSLLKQAKDTLSSQTPLSITPVVPVHVVISHIHKEQALDAIQSIVSIEGLREHFYFSSGSLYPHPHPWKC